MSGNGVRRMRLRTALLVSMTVIAIGALPAASASAQLTTESLSATLTAQDLANSLVGSGVTVSNVTYTGADVAAGTFAGGGGGIIGFDSGIILSSGDIANILGPNVADDITGANATPGDTDLDSIASFSTQDAAVLEFDFVPSASTVTFSYVFASDEYNDFVNSDFNDVFGFFVNDVNCATVGTDPVSINTINNGNPFGTDPRSHPELYRNNSPTDPGPPTSPTIDTEMDGLTIVLTCTAAVNSGVTNHMKLAIADASDDSYDSNVFLQAGSLTSAKSTSTTYTGAGSVQYSDAASLSGTLLDTSVSPNVGVAGKQLDFTIGSQTASASPTDASGNASTSLVVTQEPGSATSVATAFVGDSTYAPSSDGDAFEITKEDCTLTYTGDTQVAAGAATNLSADMGEPDTSLGNRSGKTVTFSVLALGSNVQTFTATTGSNGSASTSASLAAGTYTVTTSFAGDAFYNPCTLAGVPVTVAGDGGPPPPGPSVPCEIDADGRITAGNGDKAAFDIDVESGTTPSGKVRYRDYGSADALKVKSTAISDVTVSSDGREVTIEGKASIDGEGSFDFTVDLENVKGAPDTFRIRLSNGYDSGTQEIHHGDIDVECECEVGAVGKIKASNGDKAWLNLWADVIPQRGGLYYRDHGPAAAFKLKSTEVSNVSVSADGIAASMVGKAATKDGPVVDFTVDVKDIPNAPDTFRIRLSSGYDSGEQLIKPGGVGIDCGGDDDDHGKHGKHKGHH